MVQLVQEQYPAGWVVSLIDGVRSEAAAEGASRTRFRGAAGRAAGAGAEPQRGTLVGDESAYAPSSTAEGRSCKVVFDGVLYNRKELSDRFEASSPPATDDAELVLRAYLHWGEDVLHNVKGIFALLIWDERRNVLLCARDPLGTYPLFYADTGRRLLFSTSIEALVQHPEVSDTVNRAALADSLCHRTKIRGETFYEAVRRVPAGHAMRVEGARRKEYRYWDPLPDETEVNWVGEDELERFDGLLEQAVDRCLQLGQTGIFLSGGLDSVSVAAMATDISRAKGLPDPWALSLLFSDPESNEEPIQRRVGSELGLPHELVPFDEAAGPQGMLASAVAMSSGWPTPLDNHLWPVYRHLGLEGKHRGCRVIMTGGGGDEWLTVSPLYAADLLGSLDIRGLYRLWYAGQRSHTVSRLHFTHNVLWGWSVRPRLARSARRVLRQTAPGVLRWRWRRQISQSTPDWIAPDPTLRREIDHREEQSRFSQLEPRSFYFNEVRQSLDHPLVSMEFEENFEIGRRTGLRLLLPYQDADLVAFLYRTPPELLNKGERTKAMVRQTVARRFPRLNFERQRKVLAYNFFSSLFVREGKPLWQAMGGTPALAELGIVHTPALDSTMSKVFSNNRPVLTQTHIIKEILLMEAWLRPRLGLPLPSTVEEKIAG